MSQQSLAMVVERVSTDAEFRALLARSPDSALAGYDLTPQERTALLSGDIGQIKALGVDVRVSKAKRTGGE